MTEPHDARLAGAAACAWAAVMCVWNGVPWWWVVVAAGGVLGVLVVVAVACWVPGHVGPENAQPGHPGPELGRRGNTGLGRSVARVAPGIMLSVWCACSAATACAVWNAATFTETVDQLMAADEAIVTARVVDTGREVSLATGEVCLTPVHLTGWDTAHGAVALPSPPAALALPECVTVGDSLTVRTDLEPGNRAGEGPVGWSIHVEEHRPATGTVAMFRAAFTDATAHLPDTTRGLVRGMITGDTTDMPGADLDAMRRAGVAHVTAVSGAHFALLTVMLVMLVRQVRLPRVAQGIVVGVVVSAFALFVGPHPSVVRALGLAVAVGLGMAWGRRARALPALSVTVLVLMHAYPQIATELGFAMSVTAVVAIVVVAPALAHRFSRWVSPRLASALSIPVAAQCALLPFLVALQPGLNPYVIAANLACAVLLAPVMICGLLCVAVAPWWMSAAEVLAWGTSGPAWILTRICSGIMDLPGSWWPWPTGAVGVALAALLGVSALLAIVHAAATVRVLAGAIAAGVIVLGCHGVGSKLRPVTDDWDVIACDVGQGDMMLLRTAPGSAIVIDTGPDDSAATACLDRYGIAEIPLLILTHPDHDHDGAAIAIATHADVTHAWVAEVGRTGAAASALTGMGAHVTVPADGARAQYGSVDLVVVPGSQDGEPAVEGDNDASIVVHAQAGETSVLALGDLEPATQRRLADSLLGGVHVDAVKVAHHGSANQDPQLAQVITARWAIFSAGADNDYGHPSHSAVALYADRGATALVTAECGDIALAQDGAMTARACRRDMAP